MVPIISRGYGIVVPLAAFLGSLATELVTGAVTHDDTLYSAHTEPIAAVGVVAGAFVWAAVKLVEREHPPQMTIDQVSGQKSFRYYNDSFFFIPIRFWPYLIPVISATIAFRRMPH